MEESKALYLKLFEEHYIFHYIYIKGSIHTFNLVTVCLLCRYYPTLRPPEEHFMESSADDTRECNETESEAEVETEGTKAATEANTTQTSKPPQKKEW